MLVAMFLTMGVDINRERIKEVYSELFGISQED